MNKIILLLLVMLSIYGCNPSGNEKEVTINTADTNLPVPSGTYMTTDTDDHNKGVVSEVALDSPVGPHDPSDTTKVKY